MRGRPAIELGQAGLVLLLEVVVEAFDQVGGEKAGGEARPVRRLGDDAVDLPPAEVPRPEERVRGDAGPDRPDREYEREAGQRPPFLRQVADVEARQIGSQRRVADQEGGVVVGQHLREVGRRHVELGDLSVPIGEEDPGHGGRRARGDVEGDGPHLIERALRREEDAPDPLPGGDAEAPDDPEARDPGRLDGGDHPGVDLSPLQTVGTGGGNVGDRLDPLDGTLEEPPGERPGVDEVDERDADRRGHRSPAS